VAADDRAVYFESYDGYLNYGWSPLTGCVEGSTKYVHGSHPELFDLASDPGETRNAIEARPDAAEHLRERIARWNAAEKLSLASGEELDTDWQRELAALGYVSAAVATTRVPEPTADTGLPDPRSRMDELRAFYDAALAGERGELGPAIEALRAIVARNPRNLHALTVLSTFLVQVGRPRDVIDTLELVPPEQRDRVYVQDAYGHAFEALSNDEQALKHFLRADELRPNDRHQLEDLVRVLERLGRSEELAKVRERLAKVP
jgi:Flp pilus assembly protein TadD